MKKISNEDLKNIPMIFQCHVNQDWINESKLPQEYLGKLAILNKKGLKSYWEFEGIHFEIVYLKS